MNILQRRPIILFLLTFMAIIISAAFPTENRGNTKQHPTPKNEDLRTCTLCHDHNESFTYRRFNHTILFAEKHGTVARGNRSVCHMCHTPNACTTCHYAGSCLKPEARLHGDPRPRTPHRGDYLTRHRFDGHMDPTSCFICHGRPKTAKHCRRCHY